MVNERSRIPNGALVKVLTKPLSRLSKAFFIATAQREIHGDCLQRTEMPPSLQGFFYGPGRGHASRQEFPESAIHGQEEVHADEEEKEQDKEYVLQTQEFSRYASIVGRTLAKPTMDTSFAFLFKVLQTTEHIFLLNSCNGLVLFGLLGPLREAYYTMQEVGYILCNPATKQWVRVPSCSWIDDDDDPSILTLTKHISLLFELAVTSHFHNVLFWDHHGAERMTRTTTHSYSSETGLWSHNAAESIEEIQGSLERWRFREIGQNSFLGGFPTAFVNGMVYLILDRKLILKVDPQGRTQCIIPTPPVRHAGADNNYVLFLGQSQGILHCIMEEGHEEGHRGWQSCGVSVWVLQDLNTPKWVLKHKMSNMELFGKKSYDGMVDYHVVTVHPDCNVIFFLQHSDAQMVSYDMDHKEARALQSFESEYGPITSYTPYLSDLLVGVAGAHK